MTTLKIILTNSKTKNNIRLIKFFKKNLSILNENDLMFDWIIAYPDEKKEYEAQNIKKFPVLILDENNSSSNKIGTEKIIQYLKYAVRQNQEIEYENNNREEAKSKRRMGINEMGEFDINTYFMEQINNETGDDDLDETEKFSRSVASKMAEAQRHRGIAGQHTSSMSNPEIHEKNARTRNLNASKQQSRSHQKQNKTMPRQRKDNVSFSNKIISQSPVEIINNKSTKKDIDDDLMSKFWGNLEESDI